MLVRAQYRNESEFPPLSKKFIISEIEQDGVAVLELVVYLSTVHHQLAVGSCILVAEDLFRSQANEGLCMKRIYVIVLVHLGFDHQSQLPR
jgi:hypothetical protein